MASLADIEKPTRAQLEKELRELQKEMHELSLKTTSIHAAINAELRSKKPSSKKQEALFDKLSELLQEMEDTLTGIAVLEDQLESDSKKDD